MVSTFDLDLKINKDKQLFMHDICTKFDQNASIVWFLLSKGVGQMACMHYLKEIKSSSF